LATKKELAAVDKLDKMFNESMQDEDIRVAFARELARQMLFNPNGAANSNHVSFTKYSREQITTWLQNPAANEKNLRNASIFMYLASSHYKRLLQYYAGLLMWRYVISPVKFAGVETAADKDSFKRNYYKACNLLEVMNVPDMMRMAMLVALREGVFFGVRWFDRDSSFVQKINPDICKISFVQDGVFLYTVDMSKINQDELYKYPPAFADMLRASQAQGASNWQEVPPDISICLKADNSITHYSIPPFASVMPKLYKIADAEGRSDVAEDQENYKMIAGKIPADKDGNPKMDFKDAEQYYRMMATNIGSGVGLAITPFDLEAFSFDKSSTANQIDKISKTVENFWQSAGTSALLHGVANNTAGVTKLGIKNDESYVFGMMLQAERIINRILKTELSGKHKFKITFLPITIFNIEDWTKLYKEAASFGIGKSYYMAAIGVPQYDIGGLNHIENTVLNLNKNLMPLKNTYNTGGGESEAGRPEADETDLGDAGEATRANDTNSNR